MKEVKIFTSIEKYGLHEGVRFFRFMLKSVPHSGFMSNQFMEDLNMIYRLKSLLNSDNGLKAKA